MRLTNYRKYDRTDVRLRPHTARQIKELGWPSLTTFFKYAIPFSIPRVDQWERLDRHIMFRLRQRKVHIHCGWNTAITKVYNSHMTVYEEIARCFLDSADEWLPDVLGRGYPGTDGFPPHEPK